MVSPYYFLCFYVFLKDVMIENIYPIFEEKIKKKEKVITPIVHPAVYLFVKFNSFIPMLTLNHKMHSSGICMRHLVLLVHAFQKCKRFLGALAQPFNK